MPDEKEEQTQLPSNIEKLNFTVEQLPPSEEVPPTALPTLPKEEGGPVGEVKAEESKVPTEVKIASEVKQKPTVEKPAPKEEEGEEKEKAPEGELTKEEEKKEEEKKEEGARRFLKAPKGATPKEGTQTAGEVDLKKYSPQEQTVLKNMSVQSRKFVAGIIDENKNLAKLKDGQWFQHPEAVVLHPQFRQARQEMQSASDEGAYWARQLQLCKDGKEVTPLLSFDDKGNPVYGAPIKASDELEEQLRLAITQCNTAASQRKGELEVMKRNFKQAMDSDLQAIQQHRAQHFDWVKDPELLKYSIVMDDGQERTIDTIRKDVTSLFPIYMQRHPAVEAAADLTVALVIARAELNDLKNNGKIAAVKTEEEGRVEPSSNVRKPDEKKSTKFGGVKAFSTEGAGVEI